MAKRQAPVFLPDVSRDIDEILEWSEKVFGVAAAVRYEALLRRALKDVQADPLLTGVQARPDLAPNAYVYHLSFSRDHVQGAKVHTPRHFILYRYADFTVEFARILHDSRDLRRHLPGAYRDAGNNPPYR